MGVRRVIVHIESLVLRGFRPEDQHLIAAGLHEQLARALGDSSDVEGIMGIASADSMRTPPVVVAPRAPARQVGEEAGRSIARRLAP